MILSARGTFVSASLFPAMSAEPCTLYRRDLDGALRPLWPDGLEMLADPDSLLALGVA